MAKKLPIPSVTKVLLFSGAGLSYPLGLPMTNGFNDIIGSGDEELLKVLSSQLGPKIEDIEAILNSIDDLNSRNNLIYKYISINANQHSNTYWSYTRTSIDALKNKSQSYLTHLKKSIHNELITPDTLQCESLYFNILNEIKTTISNAAISFFTANYDLTFEDSIGDNEKLQADLQINEIDYGFSLRNGSFIFDPTKEYNWKPSILEYKKIHGSLGWIYDSRNRITKSHAGNTPDDPDSVPILYPGFKGFPDNEPFLSLHRQFLQRLIDADYAIFMGFAFRDPYINSLVDMALAINKSLNIFCYNPSEVDKLPLESHILQLRRSKKFRYIQTAIEIVDNPLKLAGQLKK